MINSRKLGFARAKRVVVKIGSNVLTQNNGLNLKAIRSITRQICRLIDDGREVILVSSGAMASGVKKVGLSKRPDELPKRQAVAAVGQAGLIREYEKCFGRYHKKVAQILLTSEDLSNRKRYLNARNTLYTLLGWQVVPIINENDTVSVEEIKLGDNDNLAAMITLLMEADILIAMSQEAYETYVKNTAQGAVVVYDDSLVSPQPIGGLIQVGIPATASAIKELDQKQAANMLMLGAGVAISVRLMRREKVDIMWLALVFGGAGTLWLALLGSANGLPLLFLRMCGSGQSSWGGLVMGYFLLSLMIMAGPGILKGASLPLVSEAVARSGKPFDMSGTVKDR